ncbi:unnamed protein product [Cyprideis torosa]|uniref:Ubiquitin-like protein ATG12 n=1 Tax=Cyprideis torosa TaxID=163714 RepID=A0A7R8ZVZ1_9CRUS|nr:unnamed protein product [Cyprideis torosa]CAG0903773.1 unnamed protein product [Cyprideis torosa]
MSAAVEKDDRASAQNLDSAGQPITPEESPNSEVDATAATVDALTIAAESSATTADNKIEVILKATGDVPILKRTKFKVEPDRPIYRVVEWIKGYLHLDKTQPLFVFVNQSFAPAQDQTVKNLFDCFGNGRNLTLYYSRVHAWG